MAKRRNSPITPPGRGLFIAAMVALTVVSVALLGVLVLENQNEKWRVLDQGRIDALHDLRLLDEIVSRRLEIADIQLLGLIDVLRAKVRDGTLAKADAEAAVRETAMRFSSLPRLSLFDPSGKTIVSSGTAPPEDDVSDSTFFRTLRDSGKDYGIAFPNRRDTSAVVRLSRRVTAPSGDFLGILSAELSREIFLPPLALTNNWSAYRTAFFTRAGQVVSYWPVADASLLRKGVRIADLPLMSALPDSVRSIVGSEVYTFDDASVAVGSVSNAPLVMALASSTDRLLMDWERKSRVHYLALTVLVGALVLAGAVLTVGAVRRHARVQAGFETLLRVLRQSPAAVAIVDAEGRILFSNDRLTAISGPGSPPEAGTDLIDVFGGAAAARSVIDRCLAERTDQGETVAFRGRDGRLRQCDLRMSPVKRPNGTIEHYVVVAEDITERLETEHTLRHAQRMEAVGQLTGGIAHEFNNLLHAVMINLDLARAGTPEDGPIRTMLEASGRAAQRGAKLTAHLLAFSRKQSLNPDNLDLNAFLDEAVEPLRQILGSEIAVEARIAPGADRVFADQRALMGALSNLAQNARTAMPDGGTLRIAATPVRFDRHAPIENGRLEPGDYVEISVADTGCGMPEDVAKHAFEPFFTTRDVGEGSGLGLSMVFGFSRQSGGNATLESTPGRGTTVRMLLPAVAA